jgi:hypothetical protein
MSQDLKTAVERYKKAVADSENTAMAKRDPKWVQKAGKEVKDAWNNLLDNLIPDDYHEGSAFVQVIAGEPIVVGNVIYSDNGKVYRMQVDSPELYNRKYGIALTPAQENEPVRVQIMGSITIPNWNLVPDKTYYATTNGLVTDVITSEKLILPIGTSISNNRLYLNFETPTFRFVQDAPSAVWTVVHNTGKKVNARIFMNGKEVEADIDHADDNNSFTITYAQSYTGEVWYEL